MRMHAFGLLVACGLAAAGCAPGLPSGRIIDTGDLATRIATSMDTPHRRRLGLGGAMMTEDAAVGSPAIQREVDRIANRLLRDPKLIGARPPRLVVVADRDYSAAMSRDGEIHVNIGLLATAQSEDEIAFVLGHEMSHYLLGHGIERDGSLKAGRGTINMARGASIYGIALARNQAGVASTSTAGRGTAVGLIAVIAAGEAMIAIASEVIDANYSRQQEIEADRLGFDLLVSAGYQPGGAGNVFNALQSAERERQRRQVDLRGSVSGGVTLALAQFGSVAGGNQWTQMAYNLGATVAGQMAERGWSAILSQQADTYDSAAARRTDLGTYEDQHHGDVPDRTRTANPFTASRGPLAREVAETMQALALIQRADDAIGREQWPEAQEALRGQDRLLNQRTPVQWRFARARIAGMQGNVTEQGRLLREAANHPLAYARIYIEQARFLEGRGEVQAALNALAAGERAFGTAEPFIADRILILRRAKREAEMARALATCRALNVGELERNCADMARE